MGLYVGNTRIAPVVRVNVTPNFKGVFSLETDLGLTNESTESDIVNALANAITNAVEYDYCLVEINYQVYNGYISFTSVDDYIGYYVIYNDAYVLIDDSNKGSSGITVGTTVAYILNNAYSVVRYNFDGTDWTSADNSGYANVDASNFTDSGTTFLSGLGMPSNRYETLTVGASGSTYTAPANGLFWMTANSNGGGQFIVISNTSKGNIRLISWTFDYSNSRRLTTFIWVNKGDRVSVSYTTRSVESLRFFYASGTPTQPQP